MPEINYGDGIKVVEAEALSHQLVTLMSGLPHDHRMLLLERTVALLLLGPFSQGPKDALSPQEAHAIIEELWKKFLSDVESKMNALKLRRWQTRQPPWPGEGS